MTNCAFRLELRAPFSPELSLGIWLRHPLEKVDLVRNGSYSRLFFRHGRAVLMKIEPEGTLEKPSCRVTLAGPVRGGDEQWARGAARWILNDSLDLEEFYRAAAADSLLQGLTVKLRGLRPLLSPTLFETLVFAIVGQQVNLAFAYTCKAALEVNFARRAHFGGEEYFAALAPEDFAEAGIPDLRALRISNSKSRAILELAAALREEPLGREELSAMSREQVLQRLMAFRGIGPWTAEYAMIRALGRTDSLPSGDAGLANAIKRIYGLDRKPGESEIRSLAERWFPFPALATYYLWTGLIQLKLEAQE